MYNGNKQYPDTTGVAEIGVALAMGVLARGLNRGLRRTVEPMTVKSFSDHIREQEWIRHTFRHYKGRGEVPTVDEAFAEALSLVGKVAPKNGDKIIRALMLLKTSKAFDGCYMQYSKCNKMRYEIELTHFSIYLNVEENYIYSGKSWSFIENNGETSVLKKLSSLLRKYNRSLS